MIAVEGEEGPYVVYCQMVLAYRGHDASELKKLAGDLERFYADGGIGAASVGVEYAFLGDYDTAMHWLEKAVDDRDPAFLQWQFDPDLPAAIKNTQRWQTLMQRPTLQELARVRALNEARGTGG